MKTSRKNGYENSLVKLPERQLWLKDLPGYDKNEKGMKTPYRKVPWKRCIINVCCLACFETPMVRVFVLRCFASFAMLASCACFDCGAILSMCLPAILCDVMIWPCVIIRLHGSRFTAHVSRGMKTRYEN